MCFRSQMAGILEKLDCEMIQNLKTSVIRGRLPNGWNNCHAVKTPSRTEQKILSTKTLVNLNEDKDMYFSFVWLRHLIMFYGDSNCSYREMAFRWHAGGSVSEDSLRKPKAKIILKRLFTCRCRLVLTKLKFRNFNGFCVKYVWIKLKVCCTFSKTIDMQLCPHVISYVRTHVGYNTVTTRYSNRREHE